MKYTNKKGEIKIYNYPYLAKEEKKFWLFIPADNEQGMEWHKMPLDIYDSKTYPICPQCKDKFVPIRDYKRCFKCRFLDNRK